MAKVERTNASFFTRGLHTTRTKNKLLTLLNATPRKYDGKGEHHCFMSPGFRASVACLQQIATRRGRSIPSERKMSGLAKLHGGGKGHASPARAPVARGR